MMAQLVTNVIIALTWMFLQDTLTVNHFILGYIIGLAIVYVGSQRTGVEFYLRRPIAAIKLCVVFLSVLIKSCLRVAYIILHPRMDITPGIVAVPLEVKTDAQITLFAGLITVPPGTLSVDVSPDRKYLYVHVLEMDDPQQAIDSLKRTLEHRIMEVFA